MPGKKKIKPGNIEPDSSSLTALNVHYSEEVHAAQLGMALVTFDKVGLINRRSVWVVNAVCR